MQINLDKEFVLIGSLERIASQLSGAQAPAFAQSDPREEVLVRYASGRGTVRPDGRGFNLEANLLRPDGSSDGKVVLSWETHATQEQLTQKRKNPKVRLDETGPIEELPTLTRVQARWTFEDGSTLTGIGAGTSIVSNLSNIALAKDAAALQITDGTGRFAGARGLVSINGSVAAPQGEQIFGNPGAVATQHTTQSFRLVNGTDLNS